MSDMKKFYIFLCIFGFLFQGCISDRDLTEFSTELPAEYQLIHYWDFNDVSSTAALAKPTYTKGNASFTYAGAYFDDVNEGSDINLKLTSTPGSALRLRNPSGDFVLSLPTSGFSKVVFTYVTMRTNNGPQVQNISYSTDGSNYTTAGLNVTEVSVAESFKVYQLDFSKISAADDNAKFKIKFAFSINSDGTSGNSRFDNISLEGIPLDVPPPTDNSLYLLHYWNFNSLPSGTISSSVPADYTINSVLANGITYEGTGAGYVDKVNPGSDINTRNGDVAGDGLRLRNPSDTRAMIVAASTAGYKNIVIKYATEKSSASGAGTQSFSYTADGTNYITTGLPITSYNPDSDPVYNLVTIDLSSISEVNNNPNFKFKINFTGTGTTGTSGNNRFDNFTIEGNIN
ncbi:hypothetical protein EGH73_09125 [Epilithonimonas hominis]|uniref:Uncharacterized protein n=2 Tax=Epilithonimonas hominis TaxID=420404 RepID=A0A3N0X7Z4_9FLAO|nr:hypothetical protein EGH73_09125 [Epilithonimonas hominis]